MRVLLRHIHYSTRYQKDSDVIVSRSYALALIRQPDLVQWLEDKGIVLHGDITNTGWGSQLHVYADMDRIQQLYYLMRWGSVAKEDFT